MVDVDADYLKLTVNHTRIRSVVRYLQREIEIDTVTAS
jgi:hypothetical protein